MTRTIKASYSRTINIGNMKFVKVVGGIAEEIPDKADITNSRLLDDLFNECEDFVLKKLTTELEEIKKAKDLSINRKTGQRKR